MKKRVYGNDRKNLPWEFEKCPGLLCFPLLILFSGKNKQGKVNIRLDIFQGDSLSPLLSVVALIPVTILRTLKQGYSFGKRDVESSVIHGWSQAL